MSDTGQRIASLSLEERAAMERRLLGKLGGAASRSRITPRPAGEPSPLSFAQQRLWFLEQLAPEAAAYNIPRALRLTGALDEPALRRALDAIAARHEALRTTFRAEGGEPVQVVHPSASIEVREVDLTGAQAAARDAELERLFRAEMQRPFDIARDLPLRAVLARLGHEDHGLLLVVHHIAADGWSMGIFVKELMTLYEAFQKGLPSPLEPLPIQYADFARFQRGFLAGPELERQLAYWKQQLAGAPAGIELPTDRPRPAVMGTAGGRISRALPKALLEALRKLGQEEGATLFMTLLAGFYALLHRTTGEEDICVGSPIAGRTRVETERLIGFFVNTLVLRADLSRAPTFRELERRVKEVALSAFAHQDMPFEKLVEELRPERSTSRSPLFQVMFILQNAPRETLSLPGLTLRALEIDPGTTKFDLTLGLHESKDGLRALLTYSKDLFDAPTMERFLEHYEALLESAVKSPDAPIAELAILRPAELEKVVTAWNQTSAPRPPFASVAAMVEAQVRATPAAAAASLAGERITYGALEERAARLASHLRALGVGPGVIVGVCAVRSIEMVVGLYAVLKAGGAYLPIDPSYPPDRIRVMLEDARPKVLLTLAATEPRLPPHEAITVRLDVPLPEPAAAAPGPRVEATEESLAYVIYTSGSTGRPKGVAMPHRPLVNLLGWQQGSLAKGPKKTLQFASVSFDVSFQEIFSTLTTGGELVLITEEIRRDPAALLDLLAAEGVERAFLPPVVLQHLAEAAEADKRAPAALAEIITAGEALVISRSIKRLLSALPGAVIHNHYGPTEAHVVTAHEVPADPALGPVTIGRPIANTSIFILDRAQRPVPIGVPGELYIGGVCLAHGYLNRPELTAERFVPVPLALAGADRHGGPPRLYRTGDLCRFREDGAIEYLGRLDLQVKIRGYRIELGEIEAVLAQHPGARESVVLAREDEPGSKRLVAYVARGRDDEGLADALRAFLRERLPEFMVPSAFVLLDRLPLNANGKVDRRALPAPSFPQATFVAPKTPVEEAIAAIFAELLKLPKVSTDASFFELGGHSLLATRVVARVRDALRVAVPVRSLFEAPTAAGLAAIVAEAMLAKAGAPELQGIALAALAPADRALVERRLLETLGLAAAEARIARRPVEGPVPLSFAQQRLWILEQMTPGTAVYNIPIGLSVAGLLDVAVLHEALDAVVARHAVLRTTYRLAGEDPVQVVLESASAPFVGVDLEGRPDREEEARRLLREEARRPFDLTRDVMIRALVIRIAPDDHRVLLTMHHIASDGWSMAILLRELTELYRAFQAGKPSPLPELPIQYTDYAVFQRSALAGEALATRLDYWRERLRGAPPFLELPTDHPRPAEISYRGAARVITLPESALAALRALCREEGATLFMGLLAAFQALLARYSGQRDVLVGVPIAGRSHVETEPLIGFFINTLALRADVAADPTFRAFLAETRDAALAAFAHQDIPFEKLVEELRPERSPGRAPLVQAAFILQNTPKAPPEVPGLSFTSMPVGTGTTKFDLTLAATETDAGLRLSLAYATDLFEPATIDRMLGAYTTLLAAAVEAPELRLSALPLLGPAARREALVAWNPARAALPTPRCIHTLFAEQAARLGDAPALSVDGERISYRTLDERSNRLARHLLARGVAPEVRVAVYAERSAALIVALLAVLKAGGAYIPLDPAYPRARNEAILEGAGARLLLTEDHLTGDLPAHGGAEVVVVDDEAAAFAEASAAPVASPVTPDNLAYVIYTSGSTGKPKGVMIAHASVAALIAWARDHYAKDELRAVLFSTSICFDVSIFELFVPLCLGGMVVLAPNALHAPSVPEAGELSLISAVPTAIAELVRMGGIPASVRTVNIAGEILQNDLVQELYARSAVERVYNLYGPTEDTTYSTCALIPRGATTPCSIGLALPGSRAYVLDARLEPVPPGVAGELYLAGAGLARGYLARPELTAERFLPDPFADEPGARMYRTGDLARQRHDGGLEILGRVDFQVKIRGYRVELGEIEAVIARHPEVREVVVVVREDAPGDRRLVAYVGARGALVTAAELRDHVKQRLPEFMVPSAFVRLEALPLSPNGKIDRKALPAPEIERAEPRRAFVAPRNPIEETIAAIWAEVLRAPKIAVDDDFFELGGHSILATRVVTRVREALAVDLPLKAVFESPTVAELAVAVSQQALLELRRAREHKAQAPASTRAPAVEAQAPKSTAGAIPRRDGRGPAPLSFAQQRLWFLEEMTPGTAVYNVPMGMRAHGALDLDLLAHALDALLERHESLRTVFALRDGAPVQIVRDRAAVAPRLVDLSRLPAEEREGEAQRVLFEEARRPFDVARDLLLRATVVRLAEDEHLLFFVVHHIASDGWSTGIFFGELIALYGAFSEGRAPSLPELPIQYADFATFQIEQLQGPALGAQLAFWRRQLEGAAPLELPTDRPRPPVQTTRGAMMTKPLPKEIVKPLRALGREAGATDFMTLLAAFQALLFRYTGQEDISVGTPIAGRNRVELEPLIGFFVNTLVMRTSLAGAPTFRELLRRTRDTALAAFEHQDVPFEKLVEELRPERVTSRTPLFQVMFVLQNAPRAALSLPGVALKPLRLSTSTGTAKFDITLLVNEGPEGLRVTAEYNTDLFDAPTIERMLGNLRVLLEGVVANPDARIDELPILTVEERRALLGEWNRARAALAPFEDGPARIHERVAAQARRTPRARAVTFEGESLRYEELDRRSNQLAHLLRRQGVGPDVLVGVCMERSLDMIVALLGVLKAGGAYVPLDPAYPKERLEFMLEDAKVPVLLTEERLAERIPPHGAKVFRLDADRALLEREEATPVAPVPGEGPDDLAYVIYTSGSTGKPKGVMVTHRNVTRLFDATERWYRFGERDVWTMFHSFAFDFSVWEIWGALFYGGRVVVVPYLVSRSPEAFYELLVKEGVTVLNQTPSAFRQLVHAEASVSQEARARLALRYVIFGGEALDLRDLRPFWERHGDIVPQLVNMYGITETTVHVTYRPVSMTDLARPWSSVIGEAIPDLSVYILDRHQQPVPIGVRGEMYVGGAGVARGYLNRPELTRERFVPDPFSDAKSARLYKTGDVARYLPSGDIEYLGRADHQVKIRGHRIELGEIEAVLAAHPDVREAVVMVREDTPGDKRLVAYLVGGRGTAPTAAELRAFLKQKLPDVMIPSAFVALPSLPLTTNGKIDRRALPKPEVDLGQGRAADPPRGPVEEQLAAIWEQVLGVKNIGRRDNFFELGGHSMLAVKMVAEVDKAFGKKIALALLFENQTVEQLARLLAAAEPEPRKWPTLIAIQPKGSRRPLFCVSTFNVNALGYVALARNLGPDQPVYGLQSRYRPEEGRPYERFEFEQLAREYIAEMKKVQPHGPYYFCGMCEGAHISFEMARLLHAEGERIGLLGILDAWPIENTRNYVFTQVESYRTEIKKRLDKLKKLDGKERLAFLGHQAREGVSRLVARAGALVGKPAPQDSAAEGSRRIDEHFRRRYWPGPDFVPPQVACPIFLFRIRDQPYWRIKDEACGWGSRTTEGVEIHIIAGDHDIILREPHVRVLAEKLNACLLRTGVSEGRAGPASVRPPPFAPGLSP